MPLQGRIVELMRFERRLENFKEEVVRLHRMRRNLLLFVVGSVVVGFLGAVLGLVGLIDGNLGWIQGVLALWGGISIFIVDSRIVVFVRRLELTVRARTSEIARLTVAFDSELENVSRQVLQEPPQTRRPLD